MDKKFKPTDAQKKFHLSDKPIKAVFRGRRHSYPRGSFSITTMQNHTGKTVSHKFLELHTKCQKCRREIPEGSAYYTHPKYGIVCEYCPEFSDGGVGVNEETK